MWETQIEFQAPGSGLAHLERKAEIYENEHFQSNMSLNVKEWKKNFKIYNESYYSNTGSFKNMDFKIFNFSVGLGKVM